MDNIAKANGESAMLNQMIFQAFAKLAAKKKRKNNKVKRKTINFINYLIVKVLANKKIYKFKRLITV